MKRCVNVIWIGLAMALLMAMVLVVAVEAKRGEGNGAPGLADLSDCTQVCASPGCISGVSLPPIMITDTFWIYPDQVCLCPSEEASCPYQFEGEGAIFMPNMQTEGDDALRVKFKLCADRLTFQTIPQDLDPQCAYILSTAPIPVGDSGFCLTYLEGSVDFDEGAAPSTIELSGQIKLCDNPDLLSADGDVYLSLEEPYAVTFQGMVTLLTWEAAEMAVTVTQASGLEAVGYLNIPYCGGEAEVHVWEEGDIIHFTGYAEMACDIQAGAFDDYRPAWWTESFPDVHLPPAPVAGQALCTLGELCASCGDGACQEPLYGAECCLAVPVSFESSRFRNWSFEGTVSVCLWSDEDGLVDVRTNLTTCTRTFGVGDNAITVEVPCGFSEAPTVSVTAPSAPNELGSPSYNVRFTAADPDDEARVFLYYDPNDHGYNGARIAECLPEETGSYLWDTSGLASGSYSVYARAQDGHNIPALAYSAGTVRVENVAPPAAPTGLTVMAGADPHQVHVRWRPSPDPDVAGYRLYTGPRAGLYTRSFDATNVTHYRLPLYPDAVYAALAAYDTSGNQSVMATFRPSVIRLPVVLKRSS